jgi:hypothetical protein
MPQSIRLATGILDTRAWQPGPDVGLHLDDATLEPNQSHRPSTGRSHLTHRPNMGQ